MRSATVDKLPSWPYLEAEQIRNMMIQSFLYTVLLFIEILPGLSDIKSYTERLHNKKIAELQNLNLS